MPKLLDSPNSIGNIIKRYRENPNDPELDKYRADIDEFLLISKKLTNTITIIDSFTEFQKALTEAIAQVKTPFLFEQLETLHAFPLINIFPFKANLIKPSAEIKNKLNKERQILNEVVGSVSKLEQPKNKPYYYYPETNSLILLTRIPPTVINFGSSTGRDNMAILMNVFMESLNKRGKEEDGYIVIGLSISEIIESLKGFGITDVDKRWISNTKNNLMNKKIPADAKDLIMILVYDKDLKGYYLKIRLTPEIPHLN